MAASPVEKVPEGYRVHRAHLQNVDAAHRYRARSTTCSRGSKSSVVSTVRTHIRDSRPRGYALLPRMWYECGHKPHSHTDATTSSHNPLSQLYLVLHFGLSKLGLNGHVLEEGVHTVLCNLNLVASRRSSTAKTTLSPTRHGTPSSSTGILRSSVYSSTHALALGVIVPTSSPTCAC